MHFSSSFLVLIAFLLSCFISEFVSAVNCLMASYLLNCVKKKKKNLELLALVAVSETNLLLHLEPSR